MLGSGVEAGGEAGLAVVGGRLFEVATLEIIAIEGGEVGAFPLSDKQGRAFARLFFASAEQVKLDGQGRVTIPQRLREDVGIEKDVVVLGARERMEIWDRETHERYEAGHGGAYRAGTLAPGGKG